MKSLGILLVVLLGFAIARPSSYQGEKRLIKTSETEPGTWLTQDEIFSLIEKKINFIDVTNRIFPKVDKASQGKELPTTLRYEAIVRDIMTKLSMPRMEEFITKYSSYNNRYYQSATGVEASEWLLSQVQEVIDSNSGYTGSVTVAPFTHSWAQDSVVARIEGADPTLKSEVIVLGAHLDSIVIFGNPSTSPAPGADDNASGSVVLLETLRVLLESGFIPKRTIELQWYAAEEVGLRGSADIAEAYYNDGVNVISMLNFDVVGYYVQGRDEIVLYTDYTNRILTQFLRTVINGYLTFSWTNNECGYGCSDHASWDEYGFVAAFPAEAVDNPYMHTNGDVISRVNFEQVLEFAKLAVGYSIEIAEPL